MSTTKLPDGVEVVPKAGQDVARVVRFFAGILRKNEAFSTAQTRPAIINGLAGLVVREEDGAIDTLAFAHRDGRITAIYATRNPDKLSHVRF